MAAEIEALGKLVYSCGGADEDVVSIGAVLKVMYIGAELFGLKAKTQCPLWSKANRTKRIHAFHQLFTACDDINVAVDMEKIDGADVFSPKGVMGSLGLSQDALKIIMTVTDKRITDLETEMTKEFKEIQNQLKVGAEQCMTRICACPFPTTENTNDFLGYMKGKTGAVALTKLKQEIEANLDKLEKTMVILNINMEAVDNLASGFSDTKAKAVGLCKNVLTHMEMFALTSCMRHKDIRKPVPGKAYRDSLEEI